ncbi:MAG: molybdopterin oxidoreductase family protein [Paracoccaceae bacterium]|nr:molybdopterin oxidoreductase family protein [Paracoccaceae bacterium]
MTKATLDMSPPVSDEVRKTTCYMCACRCGINVHMLDGKVRYIEGNRDHPINRGVLCAKGSAGIMQHYSPARLRAPLLRTGERGEGKFREISWNEALETAVAWLDPVRQKAPEKLAFFTGRDQSQSFTGWWAQQFGTPNYAAHGGFCSVNMATAGIYTMGGAFWEFGQPDWERTRLFMIFGVAEDHDSNPIKLGISRLKDRGVRIIAVNPVRTGYNAVADEWVGITPGTDGLLILSIVHLLLKSGRIDLEYLAQFTNAAFLVDAGAESETRGLFLRDGEERELILDRTTGETVPWSDVGTRPDLTGEVHRNGTVYRPVLRFIIERYVNDAFAPEAVAQRCGISARRIRRLAAELADVAFNQAISIDQPWTDWRGIRHERMTGRPVSFHAMRGIAAHSNGFQTCRALHLLQLLLGSVEVPGGFRFKPPYPKSAAAHSRPAGHASPGRPLTGQQLGFPLEPADLCIDESGRPTRIDKAFSWENPLSAHGLMHMVIANAHAGDPYPIDVLFMYMANMAWNSSMDPSGVMKMLTDRDEAGNYRIPRIIYSDSYSSEMVAFADLVLPDTTYLERHDCISLLDRPISEADAAADAIRWPVVEPDRDVRCFQSVLLDLGARLALPGFVAGDGSPLYDDYADYIVNHQRRPGIGPLAGFRGREGEARGRGDTNPRQIDAYVAHGGFWEDPIPEAARFYKPWNRHYQDWAVERGFSDSPQPFVFNLYLETLQTFRLAAEGVGERQPPDALRARLRRAMDPLPVWWEPTAWPSLDDDGGGDGVNERKEGKDRNAGGVRNLYPLHAITQRPAAMYHSWGSQNAWLRQIHGSNPLFVPTAVWNEHGFSEGDWARVESRHGQITVPVARMDALNPETVWTWNAIGKRRGAWALDENAPEATQGFLMNHLISQLLPPRSDGYRWSNSDPVTGQAAWFDLRVRISRLPARPRSEPVIPAQSSPVGKGPGLLTFGGGRS